MSGSLANDKLVNGHNAFNSERPLDVQPTLAGGFLVAVKMIADGEGKSSGQGYWKIEKVIGKVTQNAEKHEAGELREAGGKKAVIGEARAPHD
ncbi:hypothetical protein BJV77DRAFT_1162555 [Russula vinacea]|nr:hypothetical protein BJV77DRAFT_1162555 [Russula vinacea]